MGVVENIAGAGWSGQAQSTSYDTMGQMNQAFTNIVNMLHGVRDGLDPRRQQLRDPRAGLAADPQPLAAKIPTVQYF